VARAVGGAVAATGIGLSLGALARAAHAAGLDRVKASAPVRLAATALDLSRMDAPHAWARLTASLHGTGPVFAELGLGAAAIVAGGAAVRAVALWRAARAVAVRVAVDVDAIVVEAIDVEAVAAGAPPREHVAAESVESASHSDAGRIRIAAAVGARVAQVRGRLGRLGRLGRGRPAVRVVSAPTVRALAETGASRADIARRTGLSRDAVALALHLA